MRLCWSASLVFAAAALGGCDGGAPPSAQSSASERDALPIPVIGPERAILAFGDSLVAGYRLEEDESYPARLEAALRAKGINARIRNAGISGETTGEGLRRLVATLDAQPIPPELVIVSLGANDMFGGRPPLETRANLEQILRILKERRVRVLLLGMMAAPALRAEYAREFNPIYPSLAHEYGAELVPFFLQPLAGKPDLLQDDQVHPTALGVEEMVAATADDVADALPERKAD